MEICREAEGIVGGADRSKSEAGRDRSSGGGLALPPNGNVTSPFTTGLFSARSSASCEALTDEAAPLMSFCHEETGRSC
jgi:hypothetical protein